MLECKNIKAYYHKGFPILKDISFQLNKGEKIAILGRNGAGKTTLANAVFGLVPEVSGIITFHNTSLIGMPLEKIQSLGIGYFMQGAVVFPQMSVKENLLIASGNTRVYSFKTRFEELEEVFPLFAQSDIMQMPAGALSGGERTQLALAMSIFRHPKLLILDEPFAGLSPGNANLLLERMLSYQEKEQAAIILIAQDRHMASAFCSELYILRDGELILDTRF